MRGLRGRRRGVSLIELLAAVAILAICVVPIVGTISFLRTNAAQAQVESQAMSGMRSLLDQQLDGGKLTKLVASATPTTTTATLAGGTTVTYRLTTAAVSGYRSLFALTCVASWIAPSAANRTDSVTLTLYALTI